MYLNNIDGSEEGLGALNVTDHALTGSDLKVLTSGEARTCTGLHKCQGNYTRERPQHAMDYNDPGLPSIHQRQRIVSRCVGVSITISLRASVRVRSTCLVFFDRVCKTVLIGERQS